MNKNKEKESKKHEVSRFFLTKYTNYVIISHAKRIWQKQITQ